MRAGTLALMRPVITSTDGRCVASMRWMPAARAFCASRVICSSTSRPTSASNRRARRSRSRIRQPPMPSFSVTGRSPHPLNPPISRSAQRP
jgi:hypothetical protein